MFEPSDLPRVFGLPPGADFPKALLSGLRTRLRGQPPEAIARVEIFVNTRRMQRRLRSLFESGPATLMPRLRLITDLAHDQRFDDLPPPVPALRRKLELAQLVAKLLEQQTGLAPRTAVFDLADSLSGLLDEMRHEGVAPEVLRALDVSDVSGHWQRSLRFFNLIEPFFGTDAPTSDTRLRLVIERLCAAWAEAPPQHPVILAGSTGSRGATALLMHAVARLPQGAVVLPGFDFDMPAKAWDQLSDGLTAEDHPQQRFHRLAASLSIRPSQIVEWTTDTITNQARNALISLSLRPAPVTDQWLVEGPRLTNLDAATASMTLIEAPSPRTEATAIALVLRSAIETGDAAALISPDRTLTRQVTAALETWGITPDDSAGQPLQLSPPGRLLRQVADLLGRKLTCDQLLALLKHPLIATGAEDRGAHLLQTRELELWLRREGPAYVTPEIIQVWAAKGDTVRATWATWLTLCLAHATKPISADLEPHLMTHIGISEALCAGPDTDGSGGLWEQSAGEQAQAAIQALRDEADDAGAMATDEYAALVYSQLSAGEVRDAQLGHPQVMIWGTLEARVQGADLVVLGGLNEGTWPQAARPDPWLNRALRHRAGLLLPEREIGLAAHDYQQAVGARQVVLSRAVRDAEAQTVPSRWLNRLTNLLDGLGESGSACLEQMRSRGTDWLSIAQQVEAPTAPVAPASRPCPQPPVEMRPTEISITEVQTLIRDPYAVYARRVLDLRALDPLRRDPDAPLRGTVLHAIVERFVSDPLENDSDLDIKRLIKTAEDVLEAHVGWPATKRLWRAKMAKLAEWFVAGEYDRQAAARVAALEKKGSLDLGTLGVSLIGKIDRVDQGTAGLASVYDYKTGKPPSDDVQTHFDKQLLLSAAMVENAGLPGLDPTQVLEVGYIGLGAKPEFKPIVLEPGRTDAVILELKGLLAAYQNRARGYASRRAAFSRGMGGDYDHLARYGEWDESHAPTPGEVG